MKAGVTIVRRVNGKGLGSDVLSEKMISAM
jgi:hypothetical protein